MLLQPDGDLQIGRGEVVTVTVTAHNTHYLAIFSDLQQASWTIVQPVHAIGPVSAQEARSFVAGPAGLEGFALTLDFVRDQQGATRPAAEYVIHVKGNGGPFFVQKRIVPIPPFPIGRPFVFEVV
jgi:hypothetical protein